jgi:hypothetical protein
MVAERREQFGRNCRKHGNVQGTSTRMLAHLG